MTQHTELIERLRWIDGVTCNAAADALEAQAREIERLRKDAERWAMAVQITNHVIVHPSRDDESDAANAYRMVVICGNSFTEGIDAAIRALNTKGEGNAV